MPRSRRVIARVVGGLGNQLFIYATARRLAMVNDAELVLDDFSGFVNDETYKRTFQLDRFTINARIASRFEAFYPFPIVRRNLARILSKSRRFENRKYIKQEIRQFDHRVLDVKVASSVYLEGYWQSENYFKDCEDVIRRDLRIRPPDDQRNNTLSRLISDPRSVVIHVRFFDTLRTTSSNTASNSYYTAAMSKIETMIEDPHYFLFSDKPDEALAAVPKLEGRATVVSHNIGDDLAYADLWLMSQCRNFIIANSTFSWWGAWLAQSKNKIVISPGVINGDKTSWGFDGLIPKEWITIDK